LYRGQLALFATLVGEELQLYFENTAIRFALITAISTDYRNSYAIGDIFSSLKTRAVVEGENRTYGSGYEFLSQSVHPFWRHPLNDLLQDPQGDFFVDDNQFTDIALHMVKYMSEYVPLT